MKKIIMLAVGISLISAFSCSKTPTTTTTTVSIQGNWKGSYNSSKSGGDYGSWEAYIDGTNKMTVTMKPVIYSSSSITLNGSCGTTTVSFSNASGRIQFTGKINGTNMTGTFFNTNDQNEGTWSGSKQ